MIAFPSSIIVSTDDYFVMQTAGSVNAAWNADIATRGGTPVEFLRTACTIVRAPTGTRALFDDVPQLRVAFDFLPAHRLTRSAISAWLEPATVEPWPDGFWRVTGTLFRGVHPNAVLDDLVLRAGPGVTLENTRIPDAAADITGLVALRCDSPAAMLGAIEALARTPAVASVARSIPGGPDDYWVSAQHQTGHVPGPVTGPPAPRDPFHSQRLFLHGINGRGEVIGMADFVFRPEVCALRYDATAGAVPTPQFVVDPLPPAGTPFPTEVTTPDNKVITHYRTGYVYPQHPAIAVHGTTMATVAAGDVHDCLARDDRPWVPGDCPAVVTPGALEHDAPVDGMAPAAQLVLVETETQLYHEAQRLHRQVYETTPTGSPAVGLFSSSTSVASQLPSGYTDLERAIDAFSHLHRDYTILHSIGNDGDRVRSLNSPADMKSGISVGAALTPSQLTLSGPGQDLFVTPFLAEPPTTPTSPTAGSSRGPAGWFRVKPDIVMAAGESVLTHDPDPTESCGTITTTGGTSAATAAAAGATALLRQYLRQGFHPSGSDCSPGPLPDGLTPTNALIKALLINSTRNMTGLATADSPQDYASAARPTFGQGWGYPVLDDILFLPGDAPGVGPGRRTYLQILTDTPNGLQDVNALTDGRAAPVADMRPAIQDGQVHEFEITVRPGEDLHVTLAWTDPAVEAPSSHPLVADLDLELTGPAPPGSGYSTVTWRPNAGVSSVTDAGGLLVDRARVWTGGYTRLGPALCGDPPLGDEAPLSVTGIGQEYEAGDVEPPCPAGQPQFLFPQATPFSSFHHRDPFNTVENIFIPASDITGGVYTLRVVGYEVPAGLTNLTAYPDWTDDGTAGADSIDEKAQGYALVASGLVAHDRGFIHLNQAHYTCGDLVIPTIVDANLAAATSLTVELGADLEVTVCDATGACTPIPTRWLAAGLAVTPGDGVLEIAEGDTSTLTTTYIDPDRPTSTSACASAGPELLQVGVRVRDDCGDSDTYAEPGELIFVEAHFVNQTIVTIQSATAILGGGSDGSTPLVSQVMLSPLPLPPLGTAVLRVPVIVGDASAGCPRPGDIALTLNVDGKTCSMGRLVFNVGGADCTFAGTNPTPPEEVPDGSVLASKQAGFFELEWSAPPGGADGYNVYRGAISAFRTGSAGAPAYSHVRDVAVDAGTCGIATTFFVDMDDLLDGEAYYYLVTATTLCGLEGSPGQDNFGLAGGGIAPRQRASGSGCP